MQYQAGAGQIHTVAYAACVIVARRFFRADRAAGGNNRGAVNGKRRYFAMNTAAAFASAVALVAVVRFAAGGNDRAAAADGETVRRANLETHAHGLTRLLVVSLHGSAGGCQNSTTVHRQAFGNPHADAVAGIGGKGRSHCHRGVDTCSRYHATYAGDLCRTAEGDCTCMQAYTGELVTHGTAGTGQVATAGGQDILNINAL